MHHYDNNKLLWTFLFVLASAATAFSQTTPKTGQQPKEVIDAYRVCERFENILSEDLDFGRAFEATFATDEARRREIAIAEGEFDRDVFASVDTATLVDAFKNRTQILIAMLTLIAPDTLVDRAELFPLKVQEILDRKPPETAKTFPAYALQLKRDAAELRAHVDQLVQRYPRFADNVSEFKTSLSKKMELPAYVVKPLTSYSKGRVLGPKEEYYQVGSYAVIREGAEMKIIGIRFFKLF